MNLNICEIIQGIEEEQARWRSQRSWIMRYTHARERIHPPAGTLVFYPDSEIVNARKGTWYYTQTRQAFINNPDAKTADWVLWKNKQFTFRTGNRALIKSEPESIAYQCSFYLFALFRDLISDAMPIAEEAFQKDSELGMILPRCLKLNNAAYRVRKELEEVDEAPCHVLEWPGKDVLWIDTEHGFNVRRRTAFQPSGSLLGEFKASRFKERAPGIWLPERQMGLAYNRDSDPKDHRGRIAFVMTNTLHEARFNDLPDSFFEIPLPEEVKVHDLRTEKGD
jgi:hypothetical protein